MIHNIDLFGLITCVTVTDLRLSIMCDIISKGNVSKIARLYCAAQLSHERQTPMASIVYSLQQTNVSLLCCAQNFIPCMVAAALAAASSGTNQEGARGVYTNFVCFEIDLQ